MDSVIVYAKSGKIMYFTFEYKPIFQMLSYRFCKTYLVSLLFVCGRISQWCEANHSKITSLNRIRKFVFWYLFTKKLLLTKAVERNKAKISLSSATFPLRSAVLEDNY